MTDVTSTYSNIAVASASPSSSASSLLFSFDSILPSLALLLAVATGLISVITTLNKSQEDKINRLMCKIDELDSRLDSVNVSIGALGDKYVTKQELLSTEHRIEACFSLNRDLLIRLNDKMDKYVASCKQY